MILMILARFCLRAGVVLVGMLLFLGVCVLMCLIA